MLGRCEPASVNRDGRARLAQSGGSAERPSKLIVDSSGMPRGGLKQPLTPTATEQARTKVRKRTDFIMSGSVSGSINISGRADETRLTSLRRHACLMPEAVLDVVARRNQRFERRAQLGGIGRLNEIRRGHDDGFRLVCLVVRRPEQLAEDRNGADAWHLRND